VEALFAGAVADEKAFAKGEGDFLEAIYADPFDDAARMVYADFLTEREDPRGELISLQLARAGGRATEDSIKREKSLIRKHGKAWLGQFDRVLAKDHRVFERGFLTEVAFRYRSGVLPKEINDPAWATVTRIEMTWELDHLERLTALLAVRAFRSVRGIFNLGETLLASLLEEENPPACLALLEDLELVIQAWSDENGRAERRAFLAKAPLPNVKRLDLTATVEEAETILAGTLGKGATERITLLHKEFPLAKLLALLEKLKLDPKEVAVSNPNACSFVLRRDAEGKRSRLHVEPRRIYTYHGAEAFVAALEGLKEDQLTELTVDPSFDCEWDESWLSNVEEAIATQKGLKTIQVPWHRLAKTVAEVPAEDLLRIDLFLDKPFDSKSFATFWEKIAAPPLSLASHLDAYVLNYGGHTPLESADDLAKLFDKKRTKKVDVYQTGGRSARLVEVLETFARVTCPWTKGPTSYEDYSAWFKTLFEELPLKQGAIDWVEGEAIEVVPFYRQLEWMWMIDSKMVNDLIPLEEIAKLPKKVKGLEWLRADIVRQKKLLLTFGPAPNKMPTAKELRVFELAMCDLLWTSFKKERGYVPHDLFSKMVGPALKKAGFTQHEPENEAQRSDAKAFGRLVWKRQPGQAVYFEPYRPLHNELLHIELELRHSPGPDDPKADLYERETTARCNAIRRAGNSALWLKNEKEAKAAFEFIAKALPETLKWFESS